MTVVVLQVVSVVGSAPGEGLTVRVVIRTVTPAAGLVVRVTGALTVTGVVVRGLAAVVVGDPGVGAAPAVVARAPVVGAGPVVAAGAGRARAGALAVATVDDPPGVGVDVVAAVTLTRARPSRRRVVARTRVTPTR